VQPRVLVVEDEHMVGEVTCRMLAMAGYQSDSVTTGREALSLLDDGRPIDAAIIDICLPDLLGTTVGEALLEGHPDARIVFTSAYPEIRSAPPERPGTIFLAKPYTVEELLAVVGRILPLERARD
jgi:DNA-binding NtrC family response regulator